MKQQKIEKGTKVTAGYVGTHPSAWVTGTVIQNDTDKMVIRQDNGMNATVFGDNIPDHNERWPHVEVRAI